MDQERDREDSGEEQARTGWGWLPLSMVGLAAILFLSSTIHSLKEEDTLRRINDRLDRVIDKGERRAHHLRRTLDSLNNDPQFLQTLITNKFGDGEE